jgi:hypothetical protein
MAAKIVGLLLVPVVFALLQFWASRNIIGQAAPGPISDGVRYIAQARDFQFLVVDPGAWSAKIPWFLLENGLYPVFLSAFDLSQVQDWSTASAHPQVLAVAHVQALVLALATAAFLSISFRLIAGHPLKRIAISVLLGGLLLSPSVVMWPLFVFTESLTLSALLLFVFGCMAYDANRRYSLVLIGLSCCVLILIRNPMAFFVWIFAGLLGVNLLIARATWSRHLAAGLVILLLAIGLGGARASALSSSGLYIQSLVNIIQMRILPDPERRTFFAAHGMPTTPAVMERSGKPAWFNNSLFMPDGDLDPDFVAYRNWVVANGNRTYLAFLLTHPAYVLRSLVSSPNPEAVNYDPDFHFTLTDLFSTPMRGNEVEWAPYPRWLNNFFQAPFGWMLPVLFLVCVSVRYLIRLGTRRLASAMEIAALAAAAGIFVGYHTDAWDLWRHSIPLVLLIYFSMVVRTAEIAKELFRFGRGRPVADTKPFLPA